VRLRLSDRTEIRQRDRRPILITLELHPVNIPPFSIDANFGRAYKKDSNFPFTLIWLSRKTTTDGHRGSWPNSGFSWLLLDLAATVEVPTRTELSRG
jgi:hypothetical protein